jgi:hypothetical protein
LDTDLEHGAEDIASRRSIAKSVLCLSLVFWPGVLLYVLAGVLRWRRLDEEQRLWVNRYAYGLGAVFAAGATILVLALGGLTEPAMAVSAAALAAFAVYALFF